MIRFPGEVEIYETRVGPPGGGLGALVPVEHRPGYHRTHHFFGRSAWYWAPWWIAWLYQILPRWVWFKPSADWRHGEFQWDLCGAAWLIGGWFWPLGLIVDLGTPWPGRWFYLGFPATIGPEFGWCWYSRRLCLGRSGSLKVPWWGLIRV